MAPWATNRICCGPRLPKPPCLHEGIVGGTSCLLGTLIPPAKPAGQTCRHGTTSVGSLSAPHTSAPSPVHSPSLSGIWQVLTSNPCDEAAPGRHQTPANALIRHPWPLRARCEPSTSEPPAAAAGGAGSQVRQWTCRGHAARVGGPLSAAQLWAGTPIASQRGGSARQRGGAAVGVAAGQPLMSAVLGAAEAGGRCAGHRWACRVGRGAGPDCK